MGFLIFKYINLYGWCALAMACMFIYLFKFVFCFSWAAPAPCGGSQARGLIGAVATSLHQSHSNIRSELCLQPTSQLMTMPDP